MPGSPSDAVTFGDVRHTPWSRFRANRMAVVGLSVVAVYVTAAVFAPLLCRHDPTKVNTRLLSQPPSAEHWFGTDRIGRDMFARVVYGARTSLIVGVLVVAVSSVIGIAIGALCGYLGGWVDQLFMRTIDVVFAFPFILLALVIILIIGPGMRSLVIVFALLGFGTPARVVRAEMLRTRTLEYADAARTAGARPWRIVTRHLLPNSIQPLTVLAAGSVGDAIVAEAALSFLGKGIQEPTPSWGLMIARSRSDFAAHPHLLLAPGITLVVLTLALVFIGDGVRDALDPRRHVRLD